MKLMTAGYEGLISTRFFEILTEAAVETLVDVRAIPLSRKPGFSKTALTQACVAHGIRYVHIVELGCPKPIRDQYRTDHNWTTYTRAFTAYLETQQAALERLAELVTTEACCLLCFEADVTFCHRKFVAQRLARMRDQLAVVHLRDQAPAASLAAAAGR